VAKAGGTADPDVVRETIEDALAGEAERTVEDVSAFLQQHLRDT
jgi:hypothetical protein